MVTTTNTINILIIALVLVSSGIATGWALCVIIYFKNPKKSETEVETDSITEEKLLKTKLQPVEGSPHWLKYDFDGDRIFYIGSTGYPCFIGFKDKSKRGFVIDQSLYSMKEVEKVFRQNTGEELYD